MLNGFLCLFPRAGIDWFHFWQLDEPVVWCFAFFWVFALGACLGSFLNVCIWRMPRGESLCRQSSHCTTCGAPIRWFDNIPVFSYLILRGRCRRCHAPYSPRYLIVELLCGTLFAAILLKTALVQQPWQTAVNYAIAALYCIAAAWIDAEHGIIPDKLTLPVLCFALISDALLPEIWGMQRSLPALTAALLSAAIPSLLPLLFVLLGQWLKKDLFGWGDLKFLFVSGLLIGLPGAFFALFFASLVGMIAGTFLALWERKNPAAMLIPLGPFLAAGVIVWIFAGQWILQAYFYLIQLIS